MKKLFLLIFLASAIVLNAQKIDSLSVFFNTNEYQLQKEQVAILQQHFAHLKQSKWDTLYFKISGYADVSASDKYNYQLSKKRMLSVKKAIGQEALFHSFDCKAYGEKGTKPEDKKFNRRVDIIAYGKKKGSDGTIAEISTDSSAIKMNKKEYKDSLIIFPSGMECTIPKEVVQELDENKNLNFTIKDISLGVNPNEDEYTQDADGNPLFSGGMFVFDIISKDGKDSCLKKPIIIRFPKKSGSSYGCDKMRPYRAMATRGWSNTDAFKIKDIVVNGVPYFEVTVRCPGKFNLDCPCSAPQKYKFKTNWSKKYAVESVEIAGNNTINLIGRPYKKNKKVVKMRGPEDNYISQVKFNLVDRKTGEKASISAPVEKLKRPFFNAFWYTYIKLKYKFTKLEKQNGIVSGK